MKKFFQNESGQGMVEYGLILALIAVAAIVFLPTISSYVKGMFSSAQEGLADSGITPVT